MSARKGRRRRDEISAETRALHETAERLRREGAEAREISAVVKRGVSTVRKWLRDDFVPPPSTEQREMRRAHQIKADAKRLHDRGVSIEGIATRLDVEPWVARAAVYLAQREERGVSDAS